ncbi:uncharacterized protein LOC126416676 [Schistocerca serialis cubense]|uniref:uncharacterized protein LOC126416676 n=1 Tax=Schistocerca serialis cubense TaxID=2023355 RepID=UPI00214F598D|nr:uncharacterized protein LOC126416676 [Schistocerca serialis cubense]
MGRVRTWNIAIVAAVVLLECGGFSQGHQCWSEVPVDDTDCTALRDFCYVFQPYHHNHTAVLVMDLRRPIADLLVRLRSADCEFHCDRADSAPCNVTIQAATQPSRVVRLGKHFVKQRYAFHNIVGRYYCATVSLDSCGKLSDVYDTSTDSFEAVANASLKRPVRLVQTTQPLVAIAISVSLAVGVLFLVAAYCIKTRLCGSPLGALLVRQPGTSESTASPLLPSPPSAILLLYSRDSDGFARLMEAFRDLLAALTGVEVVDPLDVRQHMAEVFPDEVSWLTRYLRRQDVKVVVVVSAGALARQTALLHGQPPGRAAGTRPRPLDHLFSHALRVMQDDYKIGGDYNRVYKVRFDDITPTTETLSHIVPLRDYRLVRHMGRLVHELRGETHPPDANDITYSQELLNDRPEADNLFTILRELTV